MFEEGIPAQLVSPVDLMRMEITKAGQPVTLDQFVNNQVRVESINVERLLKLKNEADQKAESLIEIEESLEVLDCLLYTSPSPRD